MQLPLNGGHTRIRDQTLGLKVGGDLAAFLPIRKKRRLAVTSRHGSSLAVGCEGTGILRDGGVAPLRFLG